MNAVGFRFRVSLFILDFVGFHGKFLRLMDRCFFFFFSPFFRETGANGLVLRESRRISSVQITNAMRLPSVPLHLGRNINRRVTYFAPWYFTGWITSVHRGGKKKKKTKEKKEEKKIENRPFWRIARWFFFLGREIAKSWNRVKYARLLFAHMYLLWTLTRLFGPIYRVSRNDFVNERIRGSKNSYFYM